MTHMLRCRHCSKEVAGGLSPEGLCMECQSLSTLGMSTPAPDPHSNQEAELFPTLDHPVQIGPYKIREVLGKGGMGIVYLAEQEQPIRRQVALKIIKLGMDTEEVIARFESERQALAMMNHPHIAKVFDAGTTERGSPYFVMEYVPGIPISDYCDEHRLNTSERLNLFISVCLAIQHAHQKGIIHRGIKPSNVLVSIEDGKPVPKVIDFGVAKAMSQHLTEKTLYTQRGMLLGTPAYMSPEQAKLSGLDIDTTTDIYSLGVLLYEMLVGALPFDSRRLKRADYGELQKIIRDEEVLTPTKRLLGLGNTAAEVARRRHTSLKVLKKQLRGDLDWITMKAIDKDRTRRYATASEFAADIHRYLTQEPVSARAPSILYKLGKFSRRHKIGITVTALLAIALLAGIIGTTIGLMRAREAEKIAQKEAAQARAINRFMQDTLGSANPVEGRGRDITVLEALEASIDKIHESFIEQPEVESELKSNIGVTFLRLGRYDKAEALLREALHLYRQQFGPDDPMLIVPINNLAILKQERGNYSEAENYYRRALELAIQHYGETHQNVTPIMSNLALLLQDQGDLKGAEPLFRKSLQTDRRLFGDKHLNVAFDINNLGRLLFQSKKYEESALHFEEALSIFQEENHPYLAVCMGNQGELLVAMDENQKAETVLAEALALGLEQLGEKNQDVAKIRAKYGECLVKLNKYELAEEQLEMALSLLKESLGLEDSRTQKVISSLAEICDARGNIDRAAQFRTLLIEKRQQAP